SPGIGRLSKVTVSAVPHIGIDENGLGPRLGPLVVTATWARVSDKGKRQLKRKLPERIRADLDDSKVLVSCHDVSLGEAWARALPERAGESRTSPVRLLRDLCPESDESLRADCPPSTREQCGNARGERVTATAEQLERVRSHLAELDQR